MLTGRSEIQPTKKVQNELVSREKCYLEHFLILTSNSCQPLSL